MLAQKIWNASWICVSFLRRGHANLLCIVPILVYVLPKRALLLLFLYNFYDFPEGSVIKNLPANAGAAGDSGSIPGLRRAFAGGNGTPLQYSCLENPMDREAWQVTVHWVAKSQTRLRATEHAPDFPYLDNTAEQKKLNKMCYLPQ